MLGETVACEPFPHTSTYCRTCKNMLPATPAAAFLFRGFRYGDGQATKITIDEINSELEPFTQRLIL